MRIIIILTTILFFDSLVSKATANDNSATNSLNFKFDSVFQTMIDSWDKGAETNGLICGIERASVSSKKPLTLYVNVINTTTNWVKGYLNLPLEALANIELFGSQNEPIEKTSAGKAFKIWTPKQIKDWINLRPRGGVFFIDPLDASQVNGNLSIPKLFKLKQSGEYRLHLQMCLVQAKQDFPKIWLPEVVAKVEIRPEDIPSPDLPSNIQTNSPAK